MTIPGPPSLGRGVVMRPGAPVPSPWAHCPRILVGEAELALPGPVIDQLHQAWTTRRAVVVELGVDDTTLRTPELWSGEPYLLDPTFELSRERLHFLVWANNYDGRPGEPRWWHATKAARTWARYGARPGGPADLLLADGTAVLVDGGPSSVPLVPPGMVVRHWWAQSPDAGARGAPRAFPTPGGTGPDAPGTGPTRARLAPDQLRTVLHDGGAVRVIAPAGSGKTTVLTERLRHLVSERHVDPESVTVLAYNTKAADELRSRSADLLPAPKRTIRTIHSFALEICQLAASSAIRVVDEPHARALVEEIFDVRHHANTDTIAPYLAGLAAIRLQLAHPDAVEADLPDAVGLAAGFGHYREMLAVRGLVDYDEQIYRAIAVLLADPDLRRRAQERCRLLLVDEFQDLNPAHLLLIRLVNAPAYECFGVGDDDQVIYGYAGATPEFLLHFDRYFPGGAEHALEVNYRCPPAVVDAARHLLSYNRRRVPKTIRAAGDAPDESVPEGHRPLVVHLEPGTALAPAAVEQIRSWLVDDGIAPADVAVLARVNSVLLPVQLGCAETGIPTTRPLGPDVLRRTGIRTALAYLRIGMAPDAITAEDLRETIRRPSRGLSPRTVDAVARRPTTSLPELRRRAGRMPEKDGAKLAGYVSDLERVAAACRRSTPEALAVVWREIGLGDSLDVLDASREDADRSTHVDDLVALASVAALHPDVGTFESWLRAALGTRDASDDTAGRVQLSTIHRVKGREWPRVVVYGASAGILPHRQAQDMEEERRIFHVAITRARHQVVVMADREAPSVFLAELDGSRARPPAAAPEGGGRPSPAGTKRTSNPRRSSGRVQAGGDGRRRTTGPDAGDQPPESGEAGEAGTALRSWRREVARAAGLPAYVVLNDGELDGIASRRPTTMAELAACRGMGPIRLERWGDEILSVLAGCGD